MTITVAPTRSEYTATAGQTTFTYTFKIFEDTDLNVYVTPSGQDPDDATDIVTPSSVTGAGEAAGGTVVIAATTAGDLVTIVGDIPETRSIDYQNNGDFRPDTVNDDFDKVVSLVKQVANNIGRGLAFQESAQGVSPLSLPTPSAGSMVRWKGDESGLENVTIATPVEVSLNSVAAIRLLDDSSGYSTGTIITVTGYYTDGDGGGGQFYWDATNTATDNSGTIIKVTSITTGRWMRLYSGNLKSSFWGDNIELAVASISTDRVVLDINEQPEALTGDLTIPDTLTLNFTNSVAWSGSTGFTLTVESRIIAPAFRLFDSDFTISFSEKQEVWADWWGGKDVATSILLAISAVADNSKVKMTGGTWVIGTNAIDIIDKPISLVGMGGSVDYNANSSGTSIAYTGTGSALTINTGTEIRDFKITGGEYGLTLGNNTGSGTISWGGVARNIMVTGASIAGVHAYGLQLGLIDNLFSQANTAGMVVTGANNTHGVFLKCRFYNNDEEGILYEANAQFKYYGCHSEANGFEGIKNETTTLSDFLWDGGWLERNNQDATHASGYYQVFLNNSANDNCVISNTGLNSASTINNGHIAFSGILKLKANRYVGTALTNRVTFLGVNDTLINDNDNLSLSGGHVAFASQNNTYKATLAEVLPWDANVLLGTGYNNVPRLSNVTVTNQGASGALVFSLPSPSAGLNTGFSTVVAQQITLSPLVGDQIIPTGVLSGDVISGSNIGDYIEISSDTGGVYWQEVSNIGTWTV